MAATLPNFLQTRALTGDLGLPSIDTAMPPSVDVAPPSVPMATPPMTPPVQPVHHPGFTDALRKALPILIATIARARSGPLAGAGLLQGYTSELENQRKIQEHQDALDAAAHQNDVTAQAKREADAAKRVTDLQNFIEHTRASLDQHFASDPAGWAATVGAADAAASKAFGAPPGAVKSHPLLQYSDSKASAAAQKEAQGLLDAAQKQVGPDQWSEMLKTPELYAVGGKPLSDLLASSQTTVTKGGVQVPPGAPVTGNFQLKDVIVPGDPKPRAANWDPKSGQFFDPDTKQVIKGARPVPAGGGSNQGDVADMTDEAIADTAMRYHLFGASAIPTRINEDKRTRILNANAKLNATLGQSPAQAIMKQLALKADSASLNRATILGDASRSAQAKAEPLADRIGELSEKVGRSGVPLLNDAILYGKTRIEGNDDASLLLNALTEFTSEYAKIVEGSANSSGGSTVEGRRAAAGLITASMTKGTVRKQLAQMKQIMDWTIQGYDLTKEAIQNRMTAAGTPPGQTPPPVTPPALGANTTRDVVQNGVTFRITTDAAGNVIKSEVIKK